MSWKTPGVVYACCEHCEGDEVHDVEPNQHEIPCNFPGRPACEEGSRMIKLGEEVEEDEPVQWPAGQGREGQDGAP